MNTTTMYLCLRVLVSVSVCVFVSVSVSAHAHECLLKRICKHSSEVCPTSWPGSAGNARRRRGLRFGKALALDVALAFAFGLAFATPRIASREATCVLENEGHVDTSSLQTVQHVWRPQTFVYCPKHLVTAPNMFEQSQTCVNCHTHLLTAQNMV